LSLIIFYNPKIKLVVMNAGSKWLMTHFYQNLTYRFVFRADYNLLD